MRIPKDFFVSGEMKRAINPRYKNLCASTIFAIIKKCSRTMDPQYRYFLLDVGKDYFWYDRSLKIWEDKKDLAMPEEEVIEAIMKWWGKR